MFAGMGAYFGSTRINEGAAGLGQGPLQAYADGVVGGAHSNPEMPGPLTAYHDGSLGQTPGLLQAYADGVVGGSRADSGMPGPLTAYHDGSLGWYDQASHGLGQDGGTPISAFQDGILGGRGHGISPGPLKAYHDGSLGAYMGAIGAAAQNVLDLGDPNVLKEVKASMALLNPQMLTAEGQKVYTPDWYLTGIWEPTASLAWQYIVSLAPSGQPLSDSADSQTYPSAHGIAWMAATIGAPTSQALGPKYLADNMPAMNAFIHAGAGKVLPPYLSLADKAEGKQGGGMFAGMSKMAMYGLGAAALLGVVLLIRRK